MEIVVENRFEDFLAKLKERNLFLHAKEDNLVLSGRTGDLTKEEIALIKKDQSIVRFIKENKAGLLQYLRNNQASGFSAIYELSPLQQGMLFHHLYDENSKAYTEQFSLDLHDLDTEIFAACWKRAIQQHTILRTSFVHEKLSVPVQCVHPEVTLPFAVLDFSTLSAEAQAREMTSFLEADHARGFDFNQPPLMRITLIKLSVSSYKMVWTYHHILLDGWSLPVLMQEILAHYEVLSRGEELTETTIDHYQDYIQYIGQQNKFAEEKFWKDYLRDFDSPSLLPFVGNVLERNKGVGLAKEVKLELEPETTAQIVQFAKQNHLTVNTLIQGIWAFLLSKYTGNADTIFGVTVSGRSTEMQAAAQKVGLYINMLPLRAQINPEQNVADWLLELQKQHVAAREYQYTALNQIQKWSGVQGDLFDSMLTFENYPMEEVLDNASLKIDNIHLREETNYLLTLTVAVAEKMTVDFSFNSSLLPEAFVQLIKDHFHTTLLKIIGTAQPQSLLLKDVSPISTAEQEILLGVRAADNEVWFNEGEQDLQNTEPINVRFERWVAALPEAMAVVHGSERWTNTDLNNYANQVAHTLSAMGIEQGDFVGVYLERDPRLVASLLAILKIGAVYVPLDTQNPSDRIAAMISSSQLNAIITTDALAATLEAPAVPNILLTDKLSTETQDFLQSHEVAVKDVTAITQAMISNPENCNEMQSWAYMLYTSGSTGKPKGAITRHDGAMNHILAEYAMLELPDGFNFLQSAGIGSDISVWQMLAPVLKGGAVVIIDKDDLLDYDQLLDLMEAEAISLVEFVPSYIWGLVDHIKNLPLRPDLEALLWIMMVGEEIPVQLVNDWRSFFPHVRILNGYGPCEASDDISQYEITEAIDPRQQRVPIGRPLLNMNMFVLDENLELCPIGVAGELCVTGVGVGAGYFGMPEKTAESFVPNPFPETLGDTLYRTGDLGRWLPDGNLEFLGRIDRQIKIRGHRVELGEIETFIRRSESVQDAHLLMYKGENNRQILVAFIVEDVLPTPPSVNGSPIKEETPSPDHSALERALRMSCQEGLPEYMRPAHYFFIDKMPLNLSDKVDEKPLRRLITEQDFSTAKENKNYVAPRNPIETDLATIWQDLLNVPQVGVFDNFFELGGDSIITIQVVSRAKRLGYQLSPKHLFEHQMIAAIAKVIKRQAEGVQGEQGQLTGSSPLLPIQQWYFEQEYAANTPNNQAVLLNIDRQLSTEQIQQAITTIVAQHDALRFTYRQENGTWVQEYGTDTGALIRVDLQKVNPEKLAAAITENCAQHQFSPDLQQGQLLKAVLLQTPESETHDRLFIVIHHLAIDGVSWRIILEQLEQAFTALMKGEAIDFGAKSHSYREWAQALTKHAESDTISAQLSHWQKVQECYEALPVDQEVAQHFRKNVVEQVVKLDKQRTKALLQKVNQTYQTNIDDILLAALAQTFTTWAGYQKITIGLEGHGREDFSADLDIASTVGWFTNLYPVVLELENTTTPGNLVKSIKEQLRTVPAKGMGYGLLKYLHPSETVRNSLSGNAWDVVFNYLGQFDQVLNGGKWLGGATELTGNSVGDDSPFPYQFEIDGLISNGQLSFTWSYSQQSYQQETVAQLANAFITNLSELIDHCSAKQETERTPADYGLAPQVSYQALDQFLNADWNGQALHTAISAIYRLSPAQEGMLFHHLYDPSSHAYTDQFYFDFTSELDLEVLKQSWEYVLGNHTILRSGFFYDELDVPVQCVFREVEMPFEILDYTTLPETERATNFTRFLEADLEKSFDFNQAPLMRISLVKMEESVYRMVWTYHHILLDGWSMPVVIEEFLTAYETLIKGQEAPNIEEDHFEDYIRYIQSRDKFAEQAFWNNYLEGLEGPSLLPFVGNTIDRNKGGDQIIENSLVFDETFTEKIKAYTQANRITINTLVGGAWSFLLSKYTGNADTVFGVTVSGRPAVLANADTKVGMYINTLPFRSQVRAEQSISDWLAQIQKDHAAAMEYQETGLNEIQNWTGISGDLFDSIIVFENYPMGELVEQEWTLQIDNIALKEQTNYLLTINVVLEADLTFRFSYNAALLPEAYIELIKTHFTEVLNQMIKTESASTAVEVGNLEMLNEIEKEVLLGLRPNTDNIWFNEGAKDLGNTQPINVCFEQNVAAYPDATAVVHENNRWTNTELNDYANQVAHSLLEMGVTSQTFVGIYLDRSPQLVGGLLGILKAGGAYVPLDTQNPAERIQKMIVDGQINYLITTTENAQALSDLPLKGIITVDDKTTEFKLSNVTIKDAQALAQASTQNPENQNELNSWAYMLYTSGSTGKPKGAITRHDGAMNHILAEFAMMELPDGFSFLQSAGIGSDISVWQILAPLVKGGAVVIVNKEDILDYDSIVKVIEQESVNLVEFVPSYVWGLIEHLKALPQLPTFSNLQWLMLAGEELPVKLANEWRQSFPHVRLLNAYGPCEASDDITQYEILETIPADQQRVPIGKPVHNMNMFVLDEQQQLCPIGVAGELCVSGVGVGAGYWQMPEKTAASFIPNPFSNTLGDTLYRTGDLGRWSPDGNLEFLGRIDRQVKIRGNRVELGEVESFLRSTEEVKEVYVGATKKGGNQKQLVAFVIPEDKKLVEEVLSQRLHANCKEGLPDYMRPQFYCLVEEMPRNLSDKIDERKLFEIFAARDYSNVNSQKDYVAPRNEVEAALATIWQDLLNLESVGIEDNFFELGGDSIITIQVVSRAKRLGYQLSPRDLFEHQHIAAIAKVITEKEQLLLGEQGTLSGTAALLPIQRWYLEDIYAGTSQYNQSVLLQIDKQVSRGDLQKVFETLVAQHDALRFTYRQEEGQWIQTYGTASCEVRQEDLRQINDQDWQYALEKLCATYQSDLDIATGDLVRAVWVESPESVEQNRLFITIHHLAVDGVSWRILLDDLERSLQALSQNEEIVLGTKSSSFREWTTALQDYAATPKILSQEQYWQEVIQQAAVLPTEHNATQPLTESLREFTFQLDKEHTNALLQEVNQAYQTEIDDVLLSALAQTIGQWSKQSSFLLGLEGHGRADISEQIDTSNTVGWFTNLYPVAIQLEDQATEGQLLKSVKEQLRTVPEKGIGYGLLRYWHPEASVRESLAKERWEVVFNYLGQLDNAVGNSEWLTEAPETITQKVGKESPLESKLELEGLVTEGELHLIWSYSSEEYNDETIAQLAEAYLTNLKNLIEHCRTKTTVEKTAFDYGLTPEVNYRELDAFLDTPENGSTRRALIEGVYRLSPTQEGILFHGLYDKTSQAYTEQYTFDFPEGLDVPVFQAAWQEVLKNHSILRSNIFHDALNIPVQCVYRDVTVPFATLDLRDYSPEEQEKQIEAYLATDMKQGFDFSRAPLMRICVMQLAEHNFKMLWTVHHILLDGWSLPVIMQELLEAYEAIFNQEEIPVVPTENYEDYIRYIASRDKFAEQAFWKNYFRDFTEPSFLPFVRNTMDRNKGGGEMADLDVAFSDELTQKNQSFCTVATHYRKYAGSGCLGITTVQIYR